MTLIYSRLISPMSLERFGAWNLGLGTWDLGLGTWDLEIKHTRAHDRLDDFIDWMTG